MQNTFFENSVVLCM